MSSPFRIGVAGVGAIGKNHARIMAEIAAKSEGAITFSAVYDADPARAADFAAQYGTQAASDLADFAQRVDAATVAVPTIFHRKVAEPLMQAGIHVMVEKPISESYAEAQALIELAKSKSVILQVGHIERFNPVLLQLEQRVAAAGEHEPRALRVHAAVQHREDDVVVHDLQAGVVSRDQVGYSDAEQFGEDLPQLRQTVEAAVVAGVGALTVAVVAARQGEQLVGQVQLLGRRFAAGEVQRQVLGPQVGVIPLMALVRDGQFLGAEGIQRHHEPFQLRFLCPGPDTGGPRVPDRAH